jgi:hypothetical protein
MAEISMPSDVVSRYARNKTTNLVNPAQSSCYHFI